MAHEGKPDVSWYPILYCVAAFTLLNGDIGMKTLTRFTSAVLLAVVVLALAGCATTANYEKMLNGWVGAEEIDLMRKWGAPDKTYETGGTKFLTYVSSGNVYVPGVAPTYQTTVIGNTVYTNRVGGSPAQNIGLRCTTTFEVRNNKIQSWQADGNYCVAKE